MNSFFARLKTKAGIYFPKNFLLKIKDRVIRFRKSLTN
ncbi:hypothetical protein LEP1GSC161_2222 [Leptospira santarosai str. CBC1416]|uniref:Uncharacterized protein n=3 Tax=Leptospira santarosai TaxID=28183 RepID=M6VAK6_9LEPT|nr:hypothetical protein LEP1GSC179_2178 [Leptospira santarosai str. MOR084]EKO79267.1 hypothetical protein LEP1GSC068_4015 [Leptospira sp. Fiocruz LV3954]EMF92337.1 hypothetical protein LEP1GSC005_0464 [Leptospira santarosai str. ST188]EMI64200.1 hypothetical protein LEP1GSC076_3213 [Leptospira sp. Fiocruz LV4135]EMJ50319.1 hypothetical protein LEP1GSC169_0609 [Leptospira santarosai str. HAI1349]EMM87763.1 hypothetical protein LEP1GSC039_2527 [Leptospira santarosai str. 2000027870]EMO14935.1 